jgi:hypothetical protein
MPDERLRSIYGLLVLTAWSDARLHPTELLAEDRILREVPSLGALPDKREIGEAARRTLDELGVDAAVQQIVTPLQERGERELAFAACVRILEADSVIALEEFRVMRVLRRLFGFTQDEVSRLVSG